MYILINTQKKKAFLRTLSSEKMALLFARALAEEYLAEHHDPDIYRSGFEEGFALRWDRQYPSTEDQLALLCALDLASGDAEDTEQHWRQKGDCVLDGFLKAKQHESKLKKQVHKEITRPYLNALEQFFSVLRRAGVEGVPERKM